MTGNTNCQMKNTMDSTKPLFSQIIISSSKIQCLINYFIKSLIFYSNILSTGQLNLWKSLPSSWFATSSTYCMGAREGAPTVHTLPLLMPFT